MATPPFQGEGKEDKLNAATPQENISTTFWKNGTSTLAQANPQQQSFFGSPTGTVVHTPLPSFISPLPLDSATGGGGGAGGGSKGNVVPPWGEGGPEYYAKVATASQVLQSAPAGAVQGDVGWGVKRQMSPGDCEREKERERVCVCVCMCACVHAIACLTRQTRILGLFLSIFVFYSFSSSFVHSLTHTTYAQVNILVCTPTQTTAAQGTLV